MAMVETTKDAGDFLGESDASPYLCKHLSEDMLKKSVFLFRFSVLIPSPVLKYGRESEFPLIENRILYYAAAGLEIFERIDNF